MTKLEIELRIRDAIKRLAPHVNDDLIDLEWEMDLSHALELYVDFRIKEAIRVGREELYFLDDYRKKNNGEPPVS